MFSVIAKIPRRLLQAAGGSACIGAGYLLGAQQSNTSKVHIQIKLDNQANLRAPSSPHSHITLNEVTPLSVKPQPGLKKIGASETLTAASIAEELADNIVLTHTKSIREPLDFKLLFDAAKIIRQATLKNDGSRYRAFVNLCTELRQRHGHELIDSEFVLLKQLMFDEISGTIPQDDIKTAEKEAQMLKSVAATVWKQHYPTQTLPDWLADIGVDDAMLINSEPLPEQLISRLDEERDKSNAQQMAANLYHAGLADINTVSSAYEAPLQQLQHFLSTAPSTANTQPWAKQPATVIDPNIDIYQLESPHHSMEDFFAIHQLSLHQGQGTLISLCDGHGGDHIAKYLIKNMPEILTAVFSPEHTHLIEGSKTGRDPSKHGQLMKGTEQAFQHMQHRLLMRDEEIDHQIQNLLNADAVNPSQQVRDKAKLLFKQSARDTGSTALFVLEYQGNLALFHSGDTRATIVKTMSIEGKNQRVSIAATEDHKPEIPRVYRHISKLGGFISRDDEDDIYRVDGRLAVGRAFGDHHCFAVQPIPTVTKLPLGVDSLILGTDGLWDVIPSWAAGPLLDILDTYFDSPTDSVEREEQLLDQIITKIILDININKLGFDDPLLRLPDMDSKENWKDFLTGLKHDIQHNKPNQREAFVLAQMAKFLGSEDDITVMVLALKADKTTTDNHRVQEES